MNEPADRREGGDGEGQVEAKPVEEVAVWRASPSQWLAWKAHLLWGTVFVALLAGVIASVVADWPSWSTWALLAAMVVPVAAAGWVFLCVAVTQYELSSTQFVETTGIVNKKYEMIELYRVVDIAPSQRWMQIPLGVGDVTLHSGDRTTPELVIRWLPDFKERVKSLRAAVEQRRTEYRSRFMEFQGDDFDGEAV